MINGNYKYYEIKNIFSYFLNLFYLSKSPEYGKHNLYNPQAK